MQISKHLAVCLDPTRIGDGGYRLGRVDNSIVRERSSGIPYLPGTSWAGVVRAAAACVRKPDGSPIACSVIDEAFGTAAGEDQGGGESIVRFYDSHLVLFPVASQRGTIYVSTPERLQEWLAQDAGEGRDRGELTIPDGLDDENAVTVVLGNENAAALNLGWLLLPTASPANTVSRWLPSKQLPHIQRIAVVSDKIFYHLVNGYLEVRNSVAIDDVTGTAKTGALFAYEALPRGTVVSFEYGVNLSGGQAPALDEVNELLTASIKLLELFGIGSMRTRGFGRVRVLL
jgi:CRISPR-associated protein Cmr4